KRSIRTEQTEQAHLKTSGSPLLARLERGEWRRCKRHVGLLPEAYGLFGRPQRAPPPRALAVQALDAPQRLIEVVAVRRRRQRREKRYSVGLTPHCGTHRPISPRLCDRNTVSVNELIDT